MQIAFAVISGIAVFFVLRWWVQQLSKPQDISKLTTVICTSILLLVLSVAFVVSWYKLGFFVVSFIATLILWKVRPRRSVDIVVPASLLDEAMNPRLQGKLQELEAEVLANKDISSSGTARETDTKKL